MNTRTLIAVSFVVLGIVVLAYSGITFTTPGKPADFLGLHFETTVSHSVSPAAGIISLAGGIILLMLKSKGV